MLEIQTVLLWGLRVSRCLCSHETWDSCGLPAAQQVGWDSSFCQELEADGCQDIMSEVTQTTEGFSLAGGVSATARNSLWGDVRKGSGATVALDGWDPCPTYELEHEPKS